MKPIPEALTYDDVLILPRYARVMAAQVDISAPFTRHIRLNVPICSSAMDTVTHSELAIRMALYGGIGILDRNMPIEAQCSQVAQVKRYMNRIIRDPWTLSPNHTVQDARNLMQEKKISGIPVIHADGRLAGIVTRSDLQFVRDNAALIESVMTKNNLVTAPIGMDPKEAEGIFYQTHVEKLLLVDENFLLKGLMTLKDRAKNKDFPHATTMQGQLAVGAAIGSTGDFLERAQALRDAGADVLAIDSAHGHSFNVANALDLLKKISGMPDIIAGNIATADGARMLCDHGADGVKVGVGPGSICTTRIVSGVGVPQITAIRMAAQGVWDDVPLIADGGITYSGDITKAIAAGASSVMIGSLFAGTDESPGEEIFYQDRRYKRYRGMGSAVVLRSGGDRYGKKTVAEGIEGMVPHKGPLALIFDQLVGGLRRGMEYAGCATIRELQQETALIKITGAGQRESHPHDVIITNEAPNYVPRVQN